jgi:hypothetical protein
MAPTTVSVPTAACTSSSTSVNAALNALQPSLSPSCQALLDINTRSVTCFPKMERGVYSVSLWKATNDSVIHDPFPWAGGVLCPRDSLSFKAETNFDQGNVTFALSIAVSDAMSNRG